MTSIWWIRRDLRLADNPALQAALSAGSALPVFILDPAFDVSSPCRKSFLYEGLSALDNDLRKRNSYLVVRKGKPIDALRQLLDEVKAEAIYAEEDFTPYARNRDALIQKLLPLKLVQGQTVHHPHAILKQDGRPYTVYTPYSRVWKAKLPNLNIRPAPETLNTPTGICTEPLPEFTSNPIFPAGEAEALRRLDQFANLPITNYHNHRNRLDLDGTSSLSPYIRFGMLGLRQAVRLATFNLQPSNPKGAETWLNELIWREFYIQILYHFPQVAKTSFNPALARIPWRNNLSEFEAWKRGETGIPVVDAAMRQLQETGWMHNRARMIAASFLVKDLLVDWRWGEKWFMQNLLDGDIAPNNGGWQWTAGTGTDAAPYFRIFNPVLQSQKFDPNGDYIRKWIPELRRVNAKQIHAPWKFGLKIAGYPAEPIVNRDIVKERTLTAYSISKGKA
ncbi:MAG: deoxyribodipyrimidine photo-lyase [Chloroflexi bacterium]|nr:MAG: deoxyribodipyrimidine photo-lyase [Chloroflexota bacterium]MCQ3936102.1 deoxyribodipyrimidine photo-lyase [Chloroflexota bacterium]MDL1943146.1 deoxyribodipyrimidine photo-lyase [Chloroflexi bacterium CFX2]